MMTYEDLQSRLFQAENRLAEHSAPQCPRCLKRLSGEGVHTCTPTAQWRALDSISRENFDKLQQWQAACLAAEKQRDELADLLGGMLEIYGGDTPWDRKSMTEIDLHRLSREAIARVKGVAI